MSQPHEIAKLLLKIKAVALNPDQPYRYSSGILAPIYCDNRLLISYPTHRKTVVSALANMIQEAKLQFDTVAGTATAGIPHAAWLADLLDKPMVYVRTSAKAHGKLNRIEGVATSGQQALVVEDLISTGKSSIDAGITLRDAGLTVTDCIAIFDYQLKSAEENFAAANINLHALTDFTTLIDVAIEENIIPAEQKDQLLLWREDPVKWGENVHC